MPTANAESSDSPGSNPKTVLVFSPHPDDVEYYAGGTIANFIAGGSRAVIVIATDGSKGSFDIESARLVSTRKDEAVQAARVLGAESPIFLNHPDMELDRLPPGRLRGEFIQIIRQYKPHTVIAQDPLTYDIHPDHRAVAWAASEAVSYAILPLVFPDQILQGFTPHNVPEKYYYTADLNKANKIIDISQTLDKNHRPAQTPLASGILGRQLPARSKTGRSGDWSRITCTDWKFNRGKSQSFGIVHPLMGY